MKQSMMPSRAELERHAKTVPEIHPNEVLAMLTILQTAGTIQSRIMDVLQRDYRLSEGKLCVMIQLHQSPESCAPSTLAERAGITRASVSVMLRNLETEGFVTLVSDDEDRRAKCVHLTKKGRAFLDEVLPEHYLRITKLMGRLTAEEQKTLTGLLEKLAS